MSGEWKEALQKRLDENYTTFMESLQGKSASELIAMAPEITAAQQLRVELPDVCNDSDAEYLLRFDDPLEALRGLWADTLTDGRTEEISHFMWDVQDKQLIEEASKMVKEISSDDLRHMEHQEGLVLQGCGGDIQEWLDGINEMLTDAGILLDGSRFESASVFRHEGLTNLLFPFDSVKLDMGKLAMWRLQTHGQFGGTWLSDYVPNRLGGFIGEPPVPQKPKMELAGMDGNIYAVLGRASMLLNEAGMRDQIDEMFRRCEASGDYYKALNIISEYVETELSDIPIPAEPKKSHKKKGKSAYER